MSDRFPEIAEGRTIPIPLANFPQIRHMGTAVHGHHPVERYRMLGFWCVHFYTYHARLKVDDCWYEIKPGVATVFPPDAELEYRYQGRSEHVYAHFFLPTLPAAACERVPVLQSLGTRFDVLNAALRDAVEHSAISRRRAEVRLWDVLWELVHERSRPVHNAGKPDVVDTLCRTIELRLSQPLRVSELLGELSLGVSHNHLLRLFRARTGTSILDYIRRRRVERAGHLLQHSTLSIKGIASQVGLADLHLFNKTIRRILGASPRDVRAGKAKPRSRRTGI